MRKVHIVLIPSPLFPATPARPDTRQVVCTAYCYIMLETTGPRTADGHSNPYRNSRRLHSLNCPMPSGARRKD